MPNWKKLLVSGSDASLNSLYSSTYVSASSFSGNLTGSHYGTSSWANNSSQAISSSYPFAITGSTVYSSYANKSILYSPYDSIALGPDSGRGAESSYYFIAIGSGSGKGIGNGTIAIGRLSGYESNNSPTNVFIGDQAGSYSSVSDTIGIGSNALSYNSSVSVIGIGDAAGINATDSEGAIFIGRRTGWFMNHASRSIVIGDFSAYNTAGNEAGSIGANNIIIGNNISTFAGRQNGINIGGLIFGTGSYRLTYNETTNFSGSAMGKVGINQPEPVYDLDVTGTGRYTNGLNLTGSIKITGSLLGVDSIFYNTASNQPIVEGLTQWNDNEGTLELGLKNSYITAQIAQDSFTRVYNAESNTLNVGEVVYISGSQTNRAAVKRASALLESGSANALGVVAEPITAGDFGMVMTQGVLEKLNTTGLTPGNRLFLSTFPGAYTETEPTAPNHTVVIGFVQSVNATQGRIYVKIDNGYTLGELHNVVDTSNGNSYGDLIMKSGSVWKNTKTLSGSYYVSGSIQANSFTGSLFGTASYAITSSYGLNPTISGSLNNVSAIYFRTSSVPPLTTAALEWDNGEGTLQLGLVGGNAVLNLGEQLYQYVYNAQGTTLTKGQVVYGSGSQGGRIAVKLASATAELGSANTVGLVAETILAGSEGWIITEGSLKNIDTSQFSSSPFVYLSSSAGEFTPNYPQAPTHGVRLGIVEKVDATTGTIYVKIDNGYELDEMHDVVETNSITGDLLVRSGSVWINSKQLSGAYFVTGSIQAASFTGSLLGTSSYSLTASYVETARTASYFSGSVSNSISASYSLTASYALSAGGAYTHTQNIASTSWTINHNLNNSYPAITAYDGGGYVIVPKSIQSTSPNQTVLTFSYSESGSATVVAAGTTLTTASYAASANTASFAITASYALNGGGGGSSNGFFGANFDGQGSVVLVGTKSYFRIPKAGTITAWSIIADGTYPTASLDVWKVASGTSLPTSANTIIGSGGVEPYISGSINAIRSTNLTNWTSSFAANDIFAVNVDSCSVATKINFVMEVTWS